MNGRARETLRYLVDTGLQGQHLWFDPELIRDTFEQPWSTDDAEGREAGWPARAHRAIQFISALPSLSEQRSFVSKLPANLQARLCFHYFELLDAEAAQGSITKH